MHAQSPNSDEERGAWLGFREWTVQRFRGGVNACGRWPWQFCLLQSPSGLAWSGSPRLAGRHPQFWIFRAASPPPSHVVKIVGCHRPVLSVSQSLAGRLRKHDFISVPPHTSCTVGPGCPSYYALMAPSASTRHRVPRLDSTTPGPALRRRFFFLILIIKPPCWPTGNNSASLNATLVIQPLGFFSFLQHVVQFPCLGLSFLSF